jgi:DNA-binding CsgD family transcriptional regulator
MLKNNLTVREREVLGCIAEGLGCKASARALHISVYTIKKHRASAMRKLYLNSTLELVRSAMALRPPSSKRYPGFGQWSHC